MKTFIISLFAILLSLAGLKAQSSFSMKTDGFETPSFGGAEAAKYIVIYQANTPFVYTVWHSTDLLNWNRAGLGDNSRICVHIDSGSAPVYRYYMLKGVRGFFRIDTYIRAGFRFNTNLSLGNQGEDVGCLQTFLEEKGFLQRFPVNKPKGDFDQQTRSALVSWQQARGISPADGYFGPVSRAVANGELNH